MSGAAFRGGPPFVAFRMLRFPALLTGVILCTAGASASTWTSAPFATRNPPLRATMLPLADGKATLVQAPGGSNFLLGAGGPNDGPRVVAFLKKRGIKRLSALNIGTWEEGCVGGALLVLKSIPTAAVMHSGNYVATKSSGAFYNYARQLDQQRKLHMTVPTPGSTAQVFFSPPAEVTAVAPTGPMIQRFPQDPFNSLMNEFAYDKTSLLDLGETASKHQAAMWETARERPEGQVLIIGREGRADALRTQLLKPLKTRVAVIPIPRNSNHRPDPKLIAALRAAGVRVYRTDRDGIVTVTTDGRSIKVTTEPG